jgi:transcription elongation factor Elf1
MAGLALRRYRAPHRSSTAFAEERRPMAPLKDFACINCHHETIRIVLALERHMHLQCDGCGEQSTMAERRTVRDVRRHQPYTRASRRQDLHRRGAGLASRRS